MIWSKLRFQHSLELYPRVLKEVAPVLLPISLILWGLEFYVAYTNKARFDDPYNSSVMGLIVVGVIGMILQAIISVVSLLYVARSTQRQSHNGQGPHPFEFVKNHFHQTLIEIVRSFISTGIYAIFLILPGVYRWVQLTFAGLVSAFDPEYLKGHKDALAESARLVKGCWIPLFIYLCVQGLLPVIFEEQAKTAGLSFFTVGLLYTLSWLLGLYFAIYFSLTFFARWSFKKEST